MVVSCHQLVLSSIVKYEKYLVKIAFEIDGFLKPLLNVTDRSRRLLVGQLSGFPRLM